VRLGGAGRVKISRPLPADWDVHPASTTVYGNEFGWSISTDGNRVVYLTDNDAGTLRQLDSVPITGPGTASVRLDAPFGTYERIQHLISPDSTRVIYIIPVLKDEAVHSVPIAGPASASSILTWPALFATEAEITPDGGSLVWHLDVGPVGGDEVAVFRTPLDGVVLEDAVKLSGTEEPRPRVLVNSTSTRVAYEANGDIFSVPTSGSGTRYNLTGSLDATDVAFGGALTPNGQRIVYMVNFGPLGDPYHLYSSRLVPTT